MAAEMKSCPDGILPILTSDTEAHSPCESPSPTSALHLLSNGNNLIIPFVRCFLVGVFLSAQINHNRESSFVFFITSSDNGNTAGQVKLTIGYSMEESRLYITVHSCRCLYTLCSSLLLSPHFRLGAAGTSLCWQMCCLCSHRGLASCSKDGADPYVSFILLPDKKATTKRRTATKKRDLNPEFNERLGKTHVVKQSVGVLQWLTFPNFMWISVGLTLISPLRSPNREDWTCLWRTVFPSWAESGSLSARYTSTVRSE